MPGAPDQAIGDGPAVQTVALVGADYPDLRHRLAVAEGDRVRLGEPLFTDRRHPEIRYTAPGTGRVRSILLGARRRLASVVIELDGADPEPPFPVEAGNLADLSQDSIGETLLVSGLWTAFRARPYGKVPPPATRPRELFVTAMDTNPLAADPAIVIAAHADEFRTGLEVVSALATHRTVVCKSPSLRLDPPDSDRLVVAEFDGPHPAGLPGTHIRLLAPNAQSPVWYLGYQDVIAIGRLFLHGELRPERIVALCGSGIEKPRLVRSRVGASLEDLVGAETGPGHRIISGSVLSGRQVTRTAAHLGRYHQQVTVLPEATRRTGRRSLLSILAARTPASKPLDTAANGSRGGMLPVEAFERVWPLRLPPAPLLRSLLARDLESALTLGCLDLEEEDLALLSYVCPAKHDYGAALRATLRAIERST